MKSFGRRSGSAARPATSADATITAARSRIDALDETILDLLAKRAEAAREIGSAKRAAQTPVFHDPERERRVLERLIAKGHGRFPEGAIRAVFREVMSACLAVEEPLRVAYLGPEGTFSQLAARRLFGLQARYRECATIEGVFEAVESRDATYGVVPFENSTEGAVSMTSDALVDGGLLIRQEHVLAIAHCLLSRAPTLAAIHTVYSHPQALAQCRLWIAKHLPRAQVVQTSSTAAAAREAHADEKASAIGADIAAEIHDVPILRANIQDRPENATRFVVIAHEDAPPSGRDRTTIVFGVRDEKGALRRVLSEFEKASVNLTRIESRPSRRQAWHYVFLVDVEGHRSDPALSRALQAIKKHVDFVRVVGSYPLCDQAPGARPASRRGSRAPATGGRASRAVRAASR